MTDTDYVAALAGYGWEPAGNREQATDSGSWCSAAHCSDSVVFGAGKTLVEARLDVLAKVREREALRA